MSVLFVLLWMLASGARLMAIDTVVVRSNDGRRETKVTGQVVEWLGPKLTIRRASGRQEQIDSERIIEVQSTWNESHTKAEQLRSEGNCAEALALFSEAIKSEDRAWVRRRLLARLVECYSQTDQIEQASDTFAALLESDPQSPEFPVIPLNWMTVRSPANLENRAAKWLTAKTAPLRLLGASWLLVSPRRTEAITALRKLSSDPDPQVAFLATAQLWRAEIIKADDNTIAKWQQVVERMPEPLRAGPYFLVADALARREQRDQAILTWMRIPILYPDQRQLAAESLWNAANQLERAEKSDEAMTLYREIVREYQDAPCAKQAEERIARKKE